MEPKQQALILFCLASCCVSAAIAYSVWTNREFTRAPPQDNTVQRVQQEWPQFVAPPPPPRAPVATVPSAPPPKPKPATAKPVQPVTVAQLVEVYPGGFVWNPDWRPRFMRDHRWRHRDDELEWRWGKHHWDTVGREPWEYPPHHRHHRHHGQHDM